MGSGLAGSLQGWRMLPLLYSPCQGELVGRVMGQGEVGLGELIQLSFSE